MSSINSGNGIYLKPISTTNKRSHTLLKHNSSKSLKKVEFADSTTINDRSSPGSRGDVDLVDTAVFDIDLKPSLIR
jgi:hypothetical protein